MLLLGKKPKMPIDHLIIPDTHCKPGVDMGHLRWIGEYIAHRRPEVIVHLGDHFDMHSLSSYDKGTAKAEGARLEEDLAAGWKGLNMLMSPWADLTDYNPRMVFLYGNHEERIERYVNSSPELIGTVGYHSYLLGQYGWETHAFLAPVDIDGILYSHYFANPLSGRPYTASALNQLKTLGRSYVMGHRQVLDFGTRMLVDGTQQIGIIAGACYLHEEGYKGLQGNKHWRGIVVLHDVRNGFGNPMFVDLAYLERKYGKEVDKPKLQEDVHAGTSKRSTRSKGVPPSTGEGSIDAVGEARPKSRAACSSNRRPKGVPTRKKGV